MSRMLDTNTVGAIISYRRPDFRLRLRASLNDGVCVSAISYGETMYGLANKPEAVRMIQMAAAFFAETEVIQFTKASAECYGELRAQLQRDGKTLQPLDLLIAAHALETGATLVSSDRAFRHVPGLTVEDWTAA